MKWYQHGDVTIKPIKEIPKGAVKETTDTLMDGEVTGHKHVAIGEYNIFSEKGTLYLQADSELTIKHEEHKPMTIEKGNYVIGQVREYDFFDDEIRAVRD